MKKILSQSEIGKIAMNEIVKKAMYRNKITGNLNATLTHKDILVWCNAFTTGYTMGQENVKSSEEVILTTLLNELPGNNSINYSTN